MSPEQQGILQAAADETAQYKTTFDEEQATKARTDLEAKGMKINELTPDGLAEFRAASEALHPKFSELIGKEFFDTTIAFASKS
jgi:TRAP-type C4-dicarboxylate transport system substrate-binding protein